MFLFCAIHLPLCSARLFFCSNSAFDPLEKYGTENPTVYFSSVKFFHNQNLNSVGDAINGKIHKVTGANLDNVEDIVTGTWLLLPAYLVLKSIEQAIANAVLSHYKCRFAGLRN